VEVWLHAQYRQFRRVHQIGETISVRDGIGAGLIAKQLACPIVDGEHRCGMIPLEPVSAAFQDYLDEQMDAPVNEAMLPVKWSRQKRLKLQAAARRSPAIRAQLRGKRFENIPRNVW
jgi:hypothetical protein